MATTKERLLDAGLALLGDEGSGGLTVRRVEQRAGVPHGSVRHHLGDRRGLLLALVEHAAAVEAPALDGGFAAALAHWTGPGRTVALARYELALLAARDPEVRRAYVAHRERFVAAAGGDPDAARRAVAQADGLVLDALVRGA